MPIIQGPPTSGICVLTDYPSKWTGLGITPVLQKLASLGYANPTVISLLEAEPPLIDGTPDIDAYISARKTCPGSEWESIPGGWGHKVLLDGFNKTLEHLKEVQPRTIIGLGKAPLYLFTGQSKLASWRGSRLTPDKLQCPFIPTYHPRILTKQPDQRFVLEMDITRAYNVFTGKQLPRHYHFTIEPKFEEVVGILQQLLARAEHGILYLSGDIETRAGHIACMGIAWSATDALCIPHLVINDTNPFYWSEEDEAFIIALYAQLFHHLNITWLGQNFSYDCQYFWRHWGVVPVNVRDTMIGHHSLHSNIRKGLDFLSSMYAQDHIYWKDELYDWMPKEGERQYWTYNCKDACITYEIWEQIESERNRD